MPIHDELGKRMKEYYEGIPKTRLMRRSPVLIRIDGRSFHSFTKGLKRPFDRVLMSSMQETMKYLCENIQGAVLGYHQSDEISICLVDYKRFNSSAFFDYEVQKVCSISASMATAAFTKFFYRISQSEIHRISQSDVVTIDDEAYKGVLLRKQDLFPQFDARCFNIPKEEVANYFYWRQLDATRNSIEMVGQANFSHKELHKKSCNMIQDMLHEQKGINWNDFSIPEKRGTCCYKEYYWIDKDGNEYPFDSVDIEDKSTYENKSLRSRWIIDKEIPIFKNENRVYIDQWLEPEEF